MSTPRRYKDLRRQAKDAGEEDRYREAALLWEQASREARQHRLAAEEFESAVWAAHSWELVGEYGRALALLTDALGKGAEEANPLDVAVARKRVYETIRSTNPRLPTLRRRMAGLEEEAKRNSQLPESDIHIFLGDLLSDQGKLEEALAEFELSYSTHSGVGMMMFGIANECCFLNLRLGRRKAAGEWCSILEKTEAHHPASRLAWHMRRLDLAFFDQLPTSGIARDLDDAATGVQLTVVNSIVEYRARSAVLEAHHGDPSTASHISRTVIATRTGYARDVFEEYDWRLLRLDYRIACVRHPVGMDPVDDLWYTKPQRFPSRLVIDNSSDFQGRIARARRAARYALLHARDLDNRFECDWRQIEIRNRLTRLEEIVAAVSHSAG